MITSKIIRQFCHFVNLYFWVTGVPLLKFLSRQQPQRGHAHGNRPQHIFGAPGNKNGK